MKLWLRFYPALTLSIVMQYFFDNTVQMVTLQMCIAFVFHSTLLLIVH